MLEMVEDDETLFSRLVFSDEAISRLTAKSTVTVWIIKKIPLCCVSTKGLGSLFFEGNTVTGPTYLEMLQNWPFTLLHANSNDFSLQQDGVPPHWHLRAQAYLNKNVLQRWIGRKVPKTSLSTLDLPDAWTSLCVTFSCGGML